MIDQAFATKQHARLAAVIMECPHLSTPSALTGMLLDAINDHGLDNGTPATLTRVMHEVISDFEKDQTIPTPEFWRRVVSEIYLRMFYTLDTLPEYGYESFTEGDNLKDFTDWNIASLRGESVAPAWHLAEKVH